MVLRCLKMNYKLEKCKRKVVTIAQKLESIKRLDKGDLFKNVAADYEGS
jgi:hypothetical protein